MSTQKHETPEIPVHMRLSQVAKRLDLSRTTVYRLAANGTLPGLVRVKGLPGHRDLLRVDVAVLAKALADGRVDLQ